MVLHPETGSDSPIGSDLDRGRDSYTFTPFLTSQTPSEDDNSKDEQLETFPA